MARFGTGEVKFPLEVRWATTAGTDLTSPSPGRQQTLNPVELRPPAALPQRSAPKHVEPQNGAGLTTTVPATIKIDKTPLTIFGLPASCTLWPVDQKLVIVATVTAADSVSGLAPGTFKVTGVSNEPIALFTQFRALFVYMAEKLDPTWAPTYKYRAKIHFQANELRKAVANYRRVLSLNASLSNAREELVRAEAMLRATGGK